MSKNTIRINGDKLKSLLEQTTQKTLRQISLDNGFSRNLISEACRQGKASPVVQNIAKLYGITPEAYMIKEEPEIKEPEIIEEPRPEGEQISIEDLASISRDELKEIVKEAVIDVLDSFRARELNGEYDPIENVYMLRIYLRR